MEVGRLLPTGSASACSPYAKPTWSVLSVRWRGRSLAMEWCCWQECIRWVASSLDSYRCSADNICLQHWRGLYHKIRDLAGAFGLSDRFGNYFFFREFALPDEPVLLRGGAVVRSLSGDWHSVDHGRQECGVENRRVRLGSDVALHRHYSDFPLYSETVEQQKLSDPIH